MVAYRKVVEHLDGIVLQQGVCVEEEKVVALSRGYPTVVGLPESKVLARGDEGDTWVGRQCLDGTVVRAIIDHDDLVIYILCLHDDAVDAWLDDMQRIVVDNDDRDLRMLFHRHCLVFERSYVRPS